MADTRYTAAYEAAMEEVQEREAALAESKRFANSMATKAGIDPPFGDVESPNATTGKATIRSDQFANFTYPSEAARAFLEFRGQAKGAADLDTIFAALQAGGFTWGSAKNDPKGGLRIALGKDGQARRLPNGTYGLWSWYPNAKKPTDKKKASSSGATSGGAETNDDFDEPSGSTENEPS